jgi:hypothetical protein
MIGFDCFYKDNFCAVQKLLRKPTTMDQAISSPSTGMQHLSNTADIDVEKMTFKSHFRQKYISDFFCNRKLVQLTTMIDHGDIRMEQFLDT